MARMRWPTRVQQASESIILHGSTAERLFDALWETDPLGDAAAEVIRSDPRWMARLDADPETLPSAVRALVLCAREIPSWVNRSRVDRAGALLFRAGPPGGIVLGAKSLVAGYSAPAGNKPLAMTGQLRDAVSHRLAETSRYVVSTCTRGALWPGGEAWLLTLRVRLMHARVRQLIEESGQWRAQQWGAPINQHDLVATSLLFSILFLEGIADFGVDYTPAEADDFVCLWRYASWLMGARADLLPRDAREARRLVRLIERTQGDPDDDSRALTHALLDSPRATISGRAANAHVELAHGFCRALVGDELADALGVRGRRLARVVPVMRRARRALAPLLDSARMQERGRRYWETTIETGRAGRALTFQPPPKLAASAR